MALTATAGILSALAPLLIKETVGVSTGIRAAGLPLTTWVACLWENCAAGDCTAVPLCKNAALHVSTGPTLVLLQRTSVTEAAGIAESRFPGELDYNSFFLDDGVIAGKSPAVQQIVATLEEHLLEIGLCTARHKTEVAPACTSVQHLSPHDFEVLHGCLTATSSCLVLLARNLGVRPF